MTSAATTERPDDILTPDEVAAKLRLARSTVVQLMAEGKIPAMKMGRQWRTRRDAVDEYARNPEPGALSAIETAMDAITWESASELPRGGSVGGGAHVTHIASIDGREKIRCFKLSTGARIVVVGEAEAASQEGKRQASVPRVYFVRGDGGRIKIGVSSDVAKRLISIQISSPSTVELLATFPASQPTEKMLHRAFADERIRGEWFEPSDRLMKFIKAVPGIKDDADLDELLTWL